MRKLKVVIFLIGFLLFTACSNEVQNKLSMDNKKLYSEIDQKKLYEFNLEIIDADKNTLADDNFTFERLKKDDGKFNGKDIEVSGLLKEVENKKSKPGLIGYNLNTANCTVQQRGQSARLADQKSFKIDLVKEAGLWKGNEELNLNKHPSDNLMIKNKLSFDIFSQIPNILSFKTQFVNLNIKDNNKENPFFKDYGLFVNVEEIDDNYFIRRDLDPDGELYKAKNFEFFRYENVIRPKSDPLYSKEKFENKIEIENADNHQKLISLLKDINNYYIPINTIIKNNFDRENYITWLACNILIGNVDTAARNFFLYSPKRSNTWYFIPWDYDKVLETPDRHAKWTIGASKYWGNVLHKRFLKNDKNRQELSDKINHLYNNYFNVNILKENINNYKKVILPFVSKDPNAFDNMSKLEVENKLNNIHQIINKNKNDYFLSLEKPQPFFLGTVSKVSSYLSFNWDKAYDFQGDKIRYDLLISKTPDMNNIIFKEENIKESEYVIDKLKKGIYYWQVIAIDSEENKQYPFDLYIDSKSNLYYYGIKKLIVD
ncbi:MAG: CotH kinase family protein [Bacillota bacterium]